MPSLSKIRRVEPPKLKSSLAKVLKKCINMLELGVGDDENEKELVFWW